MSWLRRVALGALLGPVFPAFMWGPFTHVHINRTALQRAKELATGGCSGDSRNVAGAAGWADGASGSDASVAAGTGATAGGGSSGARPGSNVCGTEAALPSRGERAVNRELLALLTSSPEVENAYILAANSADAISSYHTLNNFTAYDYTHNSIPDHAQGVPNFGYTLIDTWRRLPETAWRNSEDRLRDLAVACGWLSHQLADWHAHYACMDSQGNLCDPPDAIADELTTFSGYSDSHRVLGHDYPALFLRRYNLADHGLTEFLMDSLLIFGPDGLWLENLSLPRLSTLKEGNTNIITLASEDFDGTVRLPEDHVPVLWKNMNLILLGMYVMQQLVRLRQPHIGREAAKVVRSDYVDLSVERVLSGLFCKSFDEIAYLARVGRRPRPSDQPIGPLDTAGVKYPGTVIFKVAYSLASSLSAPDGTITTKTVARAMDIIENPLRTLDHAPVIGPLLRSDLVADVLWNKIAKPSVDAFITNSFDSIGATAKDGRAPVQEAILAFANAVLLKRRSVEAARKDFATSMKPVVTVVNRDGSDLPGNREMPTQEELLHMVFGNRELVFKVWPAIPRGGRELAALKSLDINSVRVNVNGYPVSEHPEFAELAIGFESDTTTSPLLIRLKFGPAFRPGRYDIFVDVKDASGAKAEYLYWPVDLRAPAHSWEPPT
ncbi:MAG: zinc dependent phospholipase C family protein [Clostridia bacterium]